jgi:hypothetical protein
MTETTQAITQSEHEDSITKTKTIYDVGFFEIIWRNFLAGLSRAMGGIFLYLIFMFLFSIVFMQVIFPKLMPYINNISNVTNSLNSMQQFKLPTQFSLPNTLPSMQFSP